MEAPIPLAVPRQIGERIAPAHHHVADVELEAHDLRVGALDEYFVRLLAVDRSHMVGFIMEGEPDARAPGHGARGVEAVGPLPPVVERARLLWKARNDEILVTEPVRDLETALPP